VIGKIDWPYPDKKPQFRKSRNLGASSPTGPQSIQPDDNPVR
jgi:hypothetical protein